MLSKLSVDNPISLPISLARAKQRLHIDTNDFDEDLTALLLAATAAVEHHTGRALWPSTWEWTRDCWSGSKPIEIPLWPIREVWEVAYIDVNDVDQEVSASDWWWQRTPTGAEVFFQSGFSYPTLFDRGPKVFVRFDAGYDDPTADGAGEDPELEIDPRIEMAVLFLTAHWHENREHVNVGNITTELPDTFKFLANQLRIFR